MVSRHYADIVHTAVTVRTPIEHRFMSAIFDRDAAALFPQESLICLHMMPREHIGYLRLSSLARANSFCERIHLSSLCRTRTASLCLDPLRIDRFCSFEFFLCALIPLWQLSSHSTRLAFICSYSFFYLNRINTYEYQLFSLETNVNGISSGSLILANRSLSILIPKMRFS